MMRFAGSLLGFAVLLAAGCASDQSAVGKTDAQNGDGAPGGGAGAGGVQNGGTGGVGGAPVINVVIDTIKAGPGLCLPRVLSDGGSTCHIIEAVVSSGGSDCTMPGRLPLPAGLVEPARNRLQAIRACDADPQTPLPTCESFSLCEISRADDSCLTVTPNQDAIGWCYVDPDQGLGDPALVAQCASNMRRLIRFVGTNTPLSGAVTMIACGTGF